MLHRSTVHKLYPSRLNLLHQGKKCLGSNREPDCLGAGSSAFHTIQRAADFSFS